MIFLCTLFNCHKYYYTYINKRVDSLNLIQLRDLVLSIYFGFQWRLGVKEVIKVKGGNLWRIVSSNLDKVGERVSVTNKTFRGTSVTDNYRVNSDILNQGTDDALRKTLRNNLFVYDLSKSLFGHLVPPLYFVFSGGPPVIGDLPLFMLHEIYIPIEGMVLKFYEIV